MTDEEKKKFYHSGLWKRKQMAIMRRDHWECQECRKRIKKANEEGVELPGAERKIRRAQCVHHIKHFEDFPELALDDDNLEAVCNICHNRLHPEKWQRGVGARRKKKIVTVERW
jgi:5-methylcytosine-specific restriction endonuclease McrA